MGLLNLTYLIAALSPAAIGGHVVTPALSAPTPHGAPFNIVIAQSAVAPAQPRNGGATCPLGGGSPAARTDPTEPCLDPTLRGHDNSYNPRGWDADRFPDSRDSSEEPSDHNSSAEPRDSGEGAGGGGEGRGGEGDGGEVGGGGGDMPDGGGSNGGGG